MMVYVVFCKDYEHKKGDLMGMLVERRKDTRGETPWGSGAKWAREAFGHLVRIPEHSGHPFRGNPDTYSV